MTFRIQLRFFFLHSATVTRHNRCKTFLYLILYLEETSCLVFSLCQRPLSNRWFSPFGSLGLQTYRGWWKRGITKAKAMVSELLFWLNSDPKIQSKSILLSHEKKKIGNDWESCVSEFSLKYFLAIFNQLTNWLRCDSLLMWSYMSG